MINEYCEKDEAIWSILLNLLFMTHKQNAIQPSIQYFHCSWPKICKSSNLIEAWLLNVNATCHLFLHLVLIANATTLRVTFWLWKLFQMRFSAKEQWQHREKDICCLKIGIHIHLQIFTRILIPYSLQCSSIWNVGGQARWPKSRWMNTIALFAEQ